MKKCIVIYGQQGVGKSPTWDFVMGYHFEEKFNINYYNNKSTYYPHLPDGIYKDWLLDDMKLDILLIAQSLEETGWDEYIEEILGSYDEEIDVLFISVQARRYSNQKTLQYLKNNFDVKLFQIEDVGPMQKSFIVPEAILKNTHRTQKDFFLDNANIIKNKLANW